MYKCELTGTHSKKREPEIRIVTKYRDVEYTRPSGGVSFGHEIEKEIRVTKEGLQAWLKKNPDDTEARKKYNSAVELERLRQETSIRKEEPVIEKIAKH